MPQRAAKPRIVSRAIPTPDTSALRSNIIEEHRLKEAIKREEEFRRQHPDLWRRADALRIARNRAQAELNRRLRAAGCRPVTMDPSLQQMMKKLHHLEARNRAEIAILTEGGEVFPKKSRRHEGRSR